MSQEKVDRYKKDKANRSQIMKKQKREAFLWKLSGVLILVVVVGFIGFSGYKKIFPSEEATPKYVSQVDAKTLRETLIANGVITTTGSEKDQTTEVATTEATTTANK